MNRTAIVTGGARGIGLATVKALGREGCNVVILSRGGTEKYKDVLDDLSHEGINYLYVQGSIDDPQTHVKLVHETVEHFGRIDILVNDAGVAPKVRKDLLEMDPESFDRVVGINTKGTMFLTQAVAKQMIRQEQVFACKGHIVNVGSCSADVSSISRGEYCLSKAAVGMLTQLYADRLASEGIIVNEVRPGVIATDMTSTVKEKYNKMFENGVFPIARWGTPEDVADMICFFCSDKVRYTTGNYIDVDGGFHIKRL